LPIEKRSTIIYYNNQLFNSQTIELLHAYITPYTVRKNLKKVQPINKASDLKQIVSRNPLKKVKLFKNSRNIYSEQLQ